MTALQAMGAADALERVNVPSYVIDSHGVVQWLNPAARRIVGDVKGRHFTSVVAPDHTRRARELFARRLAGKERVADAAVDVIDIDGNRVAVELSSVQLFRGTRVIGIFGQVSGVVAEPASHPELPLTPRQAEVLRLLERGRSTVQIAGDLHLSQETVRNHVRRLLGALGVNSRLEAVAVARRNVGR